MRALLPVRFDLMLCGLLLGAGCEGGTGQVTGTLFLRGCPDQGTDQAAGMPSPLPAFDLRPTFFAAEPIWSLPDDPMPRTVNRLVIRLQRSSQKPERTDALVMYLDDVTRLQARLGTAEPLTPPALDGPSVPLPAQGETRVLAGLTLAGTCPMTRVAPMLTGAVTFSALGMNPGDTVAGQLSVTVSDPRGARAGAAPADQDAAGAFAGWFRFPIGTGSATHVP